MPPAQSYPFPRRFNLLVAFYFLFTYATTVFCDPKTSTKGCSLYRLSSTSKDVDVIQNKTDADAMSSGQKPVSVSSMMGAKALFRHGSSPVVVTGDEVIGGGDINEKKRLYGRKSLQQDKGIPLSPPQVDKANKKSADNSESSFYDPVQHRSHLFHAIEGLNRYPNYLSRWNEKDVETLERALEDTLARVRDQKAKKNDQHHTIQQILGDFFREHPEWNEFSALPESWEDLRQKILHPKATKAIFQSKVFRKNRDGDGISLQDVLSGREPIALDTCYLQEWMDEEMFDVYSFPLLSKAFCNKLCLYASTIMSFIESSPRSLDCPVSTSYFLKDMDNLGLGWLNDLIFHLVLKPISAQLYNDTDLNGSDLDWRQGFIAAYSSIPSSLKPRQRLVAHTDDSEVTLNLCFGDQFTGGDLRFWGVRGDHTAGKFVGEYRPEIGRAVVHSGRHLHEVTEITSGNRFAYIQWARCWGATRKEICPCCWLNGRKLNDQDFCVCGKKWN